MERPEVIHFASDAARRAGAPTIGEWDPGANVDRESFAEMQRVRELDSRAAARTVRQPISKGHDIHNAQRDGARGSLALTRRNIDVESLPE